MSTTSAERMRRMRERRKAGELAAVPDEEPGPVRTGVEATLARLDDPDEALCASARALADSLDLCSSPNPATAAELRRTLDAMKAEARQKAADRGGMGPNRAPSRLDQLRAAAAQHPARQGGRRA